MSTYTNTDNHPGVIKSQRRIRPKQKIELHKQFKVPIEGLTPLAEEITIKKEKPLPYKQAEQTKPVEVKTQELDRRE